MTNRQITILILKWLLIVCQSQTSPHVVFQSKRFISVLPGDKVTLDCSMAAGVSMSSYTMYWYRQDHYGQPIKFIIKEYDKPKQNYEAILNTNGNMFSLTVSNITAQDSVASTQTIIKVPKKDWRKESNIFTCKVTYYTEKKAYKDKWANISGTGGGGFEPEDYLKSSKTMKLAYGVFIAKSALYGLVILVYVLRKVRMINFYLSSTNITLPKVKILPPSPKEICSQDKRDKWSTLVCLATGFYPDHVSVSWKVNGEERQENVSTDTSAQQDKTTLMYHISSRIKINDKDWTDPKNNFTCTIHFFNGDDYITVTNTINSPKVKPKGLKLIGFGYIIFLSKSLLYALIVAGVVCKLKFSAQKKQLPED
ncbi:hypothetical protein Q8A67_019416 [Cirrhinus molitorella]|uniref:Ig-like domain-containing protein n=1 Tax=Cirrhinus molitorella TaxID=172907 RepID=A0AA88P748_9TELE|nr:hypothetical protein Q8A67_019416 [Cirrhinus molitorella]